MARRLRPMGIETSHDSLFTLQSGITQQQLSQIFETAKNLGGEIALSEGRRGITGFVRFSSQEDLQNFNSLISSNPRVSINRAISTDPEQLDVVRTGTISFVLEGDLSAFGRDPIESIEQMVRQLNGDVRFEVGGDKIIGMVEFQRNRDLDQFKGRITSLGGTLLKASEIRGRQ